MPGDDLAEPAPPAATDRLRRENTALVLTSLRDDGSGTRAGLAARTGLAKATVGAIVTDLMAVGALTELDTTTGSGAAGAGRPGRPLAIDGGRSVGLGVEVNVDYLAATALDLAGRTVLSTQVPLTGPGRGESGARSARLRDVVRLAREGHDALRAQGRDVLGLTVAVPGLVDRARGTVVEAPNLGWRGVAVAAAVTEALPGVRVRVDNDANCAATAEAAYGAGRGHRNLLYLTGTVGLGVGVVIDGTVLRGAHGGAGEVGHAPLGEPGRRCGCGRTGCWEASVGLNAVLRATGLSAAPGADPLATATAVAERAGHDLAVDIGVREVAGWLARGVTTLVATLDPSLVVLGGSFVPLARWLVPAVEDALAAADLRRDSTSRAQVAVSTLALHAASTGAAAEVVGEVFSGTLSLV